MGTYAKDHTLPKLPIPPLEETTALLKALTAPLVDVSAQQELAHAADQFAAGTGTALQAKLLENREQLPANQSWLRPIWDDNYLAWRERLPVHMNYVFALLGSQWGAQPLENLITGLAHTLSELRRGSLPVEETRSGPLSMDTLPHTVYTRIPGTVRDHLYFPLLELPLTAAIVCKGHWFILSLTNETGQIVSAQAVGNALTAIRTQADALPPAAPIGAISCAERKTAALLRETLQAAQPNRINLEAMEKAVFAVCLDESSDDPFVQTLITGSPENRWFDHSLQIISSGSHIGVNIEHAACDAGIWVYLLTQANERVKAGLPDGGCAAVRALTWQLPAETAALLQQEARAFTAFTSPLSFCQHTLDLLSRERIKAKQCSPDFFVQMLFQAAYYQLTGQFVSVYEAVSTRNFYQGRTECMRPVSSESAAFVRALVDGNTDQAALQEAFKQAGLVHSARIKRAQEALGAERHLSGLTAMLEQLPDTEPPQLFRTFGYQALKHDTISTSSTTAPFIDYFGFGPVVTDGIGLGYGVKADGLHLSVSAYRDSGIVPDTFVATLKTLAEKMFALL